MSFKSPPTDFTNLIFLQYIPRSETTLSALVPIIWLGSEELSFEFYGKSQVTLDLKTYRLLSDALSPNAFISTLSRFSWLPCTTEAESSGYSSKIESEVRFQKTPSKGWNYDLNKLRGYNLLFLFFVFLTFYKCFSLYTPLFSHAMLSQTGQSHQLYFGGWCCQSSNLTE